MGKNRQGGDSPQTSTSGLIRWSAKNVFLVVLMMLFIRGRIFPKPKYPINRFLIWTNRPAIYALVKQVGLHHQPSARD